MTAARPLRRRRFTEIASPVSFSSCGASGGPGNPAREKRPARFAPHAPPVALKFEFFAHSIDVSMLEPIMRQARTRARPSANGAVPLYGSDDSVFKVHCPPGPLAGADYSELLDMCASPATYAGVSTRVGGVFQRRILCPRRLSGNSALGFIAIFARSFSSNVTEVFHLPKTQGVISVCKVQHLCYTIYRRCFLCPPRIQE